MHRVVLFLTPVSTCSVPSYFRYVYLSCVSGIFFGSFLQKDILYTLLDTLLFLGATLTISI